MDPEMIYFFADVVVVIATTIIARSGWMTWQMIGGTALLITTWYVRSTLIRQYEKKKFDRSQTPSTN
jgi:hypothetical protein